MSPSLYGMLEGKIKYALYGVVSTIAAKARMTIFRYSSGFIFVVDSNDHEMIDEARDELSRMLGDEGLRETPLLVLANKQDLPNAMQACEIKRQWSAASPHLRRTPPHPDEHVPLSAGAREGDPAASSVTRDQRDVLVTKAIAGADEWTDHCLVLSKMRIRPQLRRRPQERIRGEPLVQLRDTVQSTALAVLGRARRQHQGWFDDNDTVISNLLAEKNRLHKAYLDHPTDDNKAAIYRSRCHLQQRLREIQDVWTAPKAEEIQGFADSNEWKNFFAAIKAVYGQPTKDTAPLLSANGSTLLTERTQILHRWAEHFRGVLNRPSAISDAAIDRLPQVETNVDLDLPPSLEETIRAVQQFFSGKASGSDAIPAEVYKHGGPQLMDHLTALFQEMWRQGEVPQDFKDATIVHLYKRKRIAMGLFGHMPVHDDLRWTTAGCITSSHPPSLIHHHPTTHQHTPTATTHLPPSTQVKANMKDKGFSLSD
ncbi:hypothetical protein SprV_0702455600 [Sparganum proliferum]